MPCKDTTASISINFDNQEQLLGFDFSKLTCQKPIGGNNGYLELCKGKSMHDLAEQEFFEVVSTLNVVGSEEQFLLYLEWEALRAAILHYLGKSDELDTQRFQLESILYEEDGVEIRQVITPPEEMPKIIPCVTTRKDISES